MVLLPILVLAEGATVARCVAATAGLAGLPSTVPAALERQWGRRKKVDKINLWALNHPYASLFKTVILCYMGRCLSSIDHLKRKNYTINSKGVNARSVKCQVFLGTKVLLNTQITEHY